MVEEETDNDTYVMDFECKNCNEAETEYEVPKEMLTTDFIKTAKCSVCGCLSLFIYKEEE